MASSGPPPNYYAILETSETATQQQIRDAYKRSALKTHPDRVSAESPERAIRTRQFQLVNDAYYTLSDPGRRQAYDAQRRSSANSGTGDATAGGDNDGNGGSSYKWSWNFSTGQGQDQDGDGDGERQRREDEQFSDVFEEMMREEGMAEPDGSGRPTPYFWSVVGGLGGGALGFIVANVPGLVAGAVAGNRLGAIRDAKGKSVHAVFQELAPDDRARLLSQLAAKVFSQIAGV